ncbi:hypothetical protein ABZV87_10725 [Streptomyces tendae]|uniref:hypothetical protein n=1 Tax=Streptomyces tendae TaxID=1932 RepID=UPI00339FEDCD
MTWVTAGNRASTENTTRATPTTGTARVRGAAGTANAADTAGTAGTANVPRADVPRGGAPHRRARRSSVRAVALGLGLAGALVLTACTDDGGSDGGSGGDSAGGDKSSAAPGTSASTDPGDGGDGGSPSAGAAGELEGSWLATTDGQAVALMVTGGKAALFATGGTVCSGTTEETSGTRTIHLKCTAGDDDRSTGKVGAVDATSLTVAWEGGLGEETYTRSEGGSLPPGLPTAGLGS